MNVKFPLSFLMTLLAGFFFSSAHSFSQAKGVVKFQIENDNGYFEVLVSDTILIKKYTDSLAVGHYKAQVWSYGYDVQDFEFNVAKDSVTFAYVKLNRSTAYGAYSQSYQNYRTKFRTSVTLPATLTLVFGLTSVTCAVIAYDLKKKINTDIFNYSQTSDPTEIDAYKVAVAENNARYNRMRIGFYVSSGVTLLGIATTIYSSIQFKRNNVEPTYSKVSPFNNKMSLQFNANGAAIIFKLG